jgi:hypothetical protein
MSEAPRFGRFNSPESHERYGELRTEIVTMAFRKARCLLCAAPAIELTRQ